MVIPKFIKSKYSSFILLYEKISSDEGFLGHTAGILWGEERQPVYIIIILLEYHNEKLMKNYR